MSFPDSCPFCGSTNVKARTLPAFFQELGRGYAVVCFDCFARGPYVRMDKYERTSHSIDAKFEAVTRWNKALRTQQEERFGKRDWGKIKETLVGMAIETMQRKSVALEYLDKESIERLSGYYDALVCVCELLSEMTEEDDGK